MNDQVIDDLSGRTDTSRQLSQKATASLAKTAGWIKFAAILGFVSVAFSFIILAVQIGNASGTAYSLGTSLGRGLVSIISNTIGVFTSYYLLMYANKLKQYTQGGRSSDLRLAFHNQKIYYTIMGVLCIVYIGIMILGLIAALILIPSMHR
jgi:hypothetical protein